MDEKTNGLSREFIIHPGETLKEIIEDRNMAQKELALRTEVTEAHVSNIVNGKKSISTRYAKKLEYALSIDASFWINLQTNYDKELVDFEELNNISSDELEIIKRLSDIIDYLKDRKFLEPNAYESILVIYLRKLLNVSHLKQIPEISQKGAYRIDQNVSVDPYVLFTWLRMSDLVSARQEIDNVLDKEKLSKMIPKIKTLMFKKDFEIEIKLREYLGKCGIKFSIVKYFRGVPIQGIIRENGDGTLSLVMTNRRKFSDIFWFTFFHEIGHILNDDVKGKLIDFENIENAAETKADKFASNTLIKESDYTSFINKANFSLPSIKKFSTEYNMPCFILIGRLQKDGYLEYQDYFNQKTIYSFDRQE
jgi:HTH-type transcriptional regulator/antitoxin HigA